MAMVNFIRLLDKDGKTLVDKDTSKPQELKGYHSFKRSKLDVDLVYTDYKDYKSTTT